MTKKETQLNAKPSSQELSRTSTPEKLLARFNPFPSEEMQRKIDFYITPYSPNQELKKCIKFRDNDEKYIYFLKQNLRNRSLSKSDIKTIEQAIWKIG